MKAFGAVLVASLGLTSRALADGGASAAAGPSAPSRDSILTLGAQGRRIYGTPTWLGVARVGAVFRRFDLVMEGGRGQTSSSLLVNDFALSTFVRGEVLPGVRFGFSAAVGRLSVERVTNASALNLWYSRLGARVEVDFAARAESAPLVAVDVAAAGPGDASLLVVVAAGARF